MRTRTDFLGYAARNFPPPRLSLRKFPFAISQIAQWLQVWLAIEMCHDRVIRSMRASAGRLRFMTFFQPGTVVQ